MGGDTHPPFRAGFVALVGEPNVGKSTLLNTLLRQKISIVTNKPQTTRHKVLGILTGDSYQAVFLDTPGLITPRYALHDAMMASASAAMQDADLILWLIDASAPPQVGEPVSLLKRLTDLAKPVFLVINKVDLVNKADLLPLIERCAGSFSFEEVFPLSALKPRNTLPLLSAVVALLPVHPAYYPSDTLSDQNERFFVAEIIREKVFLKTHEEVPYASTVDIVEFREREGGKWFISAEVYVERESQRGILIGKHGTMLKVIGSMARTEIETFIGHPVFLELHVKVRERWRSDGTWVRRLGYRS